MAFVALSSGSDGDLSTQAAYQYGFYADDVLLLDNSSFTIRSYEGNDFVHLLRCDISNSLHRVYLGSGNDRLEADYGNQEVYDGSGNDSVSTGRDFDDFYVGAGNDRLDGGVGIDRLYFSYLSNDYGALVANSSGVTCDLAIATAQNFGIFGSDIVLNFENISGSDGNDRFFGTNGNNVFNGGRGSDWLDGRGGNDSLFADEGSDLLIGGAGADYSDVADLNPERDTIRYLAITDSGVTATTWDSVYRFDSTSGATEDIIDLRAIDANPLLAGDQAFAWRGTTPAFSQAGGEVRLKIVGGDTYICIDNDADATTEMVILVSATTTLSQANFLL
jgi:serralysin